MRRKREVGQKYLTCKSGRQFCYFTDGDPDPRRRRWYRSRYGDINPQNRGERLGNTFGMALVRRESAGRRSGLSSKEGCDSVGYA